MQPLPPPPPELGAPALLVPPLLVPPLLVPAMPAPPAPEPARDDTEPPRPAFGALPPLPAASSKTSRMV
jgi:hypothetical protein